MSSTSKPKRRLKAQTGLKIRSATIYDAVAGRVSETIREMRPARPFTRDGEKTDYMKLREPYVLENEFKVPGHNPGLSRSARNLKRKRLVIESEDENDDGSSQDSLEDESEEDGEDENLVKEEEEGEGNVKSSKYQIFEDEEMMEVDEEEEEDGFREQQKEKDASERYLDWLSNLPKDLALPDSDMLKAIHTYASDFYGAFGDAQTHGLQTSGTRHIAEAGFKSMDPTALIAMGILVEELAAKELGPDGDLSLLEPFGEEQGTQIPGAKEKWWNGKDFIPRVLKDYQSTKKMDKQRNDAYMQALRRRKEERKLAVELKQPVPEPLGRQRNRLGLPNLRAKPDPFETDVDEEDQPILR